MLMHEQTTLPLEAVISNLKINLLSLTLLGGLLKCRTTTALSRSSTASTGIASKQKRV